MPVQSFLQMGQGIDYYDASVKATALDMSEAVIVTPRVTSSDTISTYMISTTEEYADYTSARVAISGSGWGY